MKTKIIIILSLLAAATGRAGDADLPAGVNAFLRQVVQSLLADPPAVTFAVADRVFAMDNGETIPKAELEKAWPELARRAFTAKVTVEQFFREVDIKVSPANENKRLISEKRLQSVYQYRDGDLFCDLSHVKDGVPNFIGYAKAFQYLLRQVDGRWTLLAIGG